MRLLIVISLALIFCLSCTESKFNSGTPEIGGSYDCIIEVSILKQNEEPIYYEQCGFFTFEAGRFTFNWDVYFGLDEQRCQLHMNEFFGEYSIDETIILHKVIQTLVGFPNEYPLGDEYDYRLVHAPSVDSLIMWQTKTEHYETGNGDFDITYEATIKLKKLDD